jgi:hypothetical protein
MARTHQVETNRLISVETVAERVRRIGDCVDRLLELPLKDREFAISYVTELQRNAEIALMKKRLGKDRVTLDEFFAVLGDNEDGEETDQH